MDNTHVVAVRPDGKELYVYSYDPSDFILVVDLTSQNYPVIDKIELPGKRANHSFIYFSSDSTHAYMSRLLSRDYEGYDGSFSDFNKILVINTAKRQVESEILMPYPYAACECVVPSPDGRWLYFSGADHSIPSLGIGKVDLQSQRVVDFLPLDGTGFITVSSDGEHIYATQGGNIYRAPPQEWFRPTNHLSVIDTDSFRVVSSVPVGDGPRYATVTPDGQKAYVSNQWSNDISVVDLKTMKIITTINLGISPEAIAITPDGKKAYVTLPGIFLKYQFGHELAIINISQDKLTNIISVTRGEPQGIAIHPDGTRVFVSDGNANGPNPSQIHVVDAVNDVYLRPIILRAAALYMPTAIDVTPDGQRLFVVSEAKKGQASDTSLMVIDIPTGFTISRLNLQPRGVKVSHDGTKVYVFSPQKFCILNSDSLEVVKSIDLGKVYPSGDVGDQEAFRIVLNQAEDTAYLLGVTTDIIVVNLTIGEIVGKIPFAERPIQHSRGLALTPDGKKLLVSDYHSQTVVIIDTSTNAIEVRIPVDNMPAEIEISADGRLAYVSQDTGATVITVIDIYKGSVLKTYPFYTSSARDLELSQDERYAYIPDFDPNFLLVYDMQAGKAAILIKVGLDPFNIASTPDKRLMYVTNFTSDDISVVDTTTNTVVKTIKLGNGL
jgi:YVTN family beta-propeller protein